jgi:general secretion pathway protein A
MYEQFFGFRERPFDLNPNPRFLVLTESHRVVLSNLEYAISSRKGITLVTGEAGSGKTTLIRTVLQKQPEQIHSVHLTNPTLSRGEFVQMLASKFGLSNQAAGSKAVLLTDLEALFRARRARGEGTVLIVDEAQSLPLELIEEIRLLANIEADDERLLSVVLVGQPTLAERLEQPELRQLKQRVALRCQLQSLTARETSDYLRGRIDVAGGVAAHVFTREAANAIHAAAAGLPRMINVLADNSLLGGFAEGIKPVPSRIVREVTRDFGLTQSDSSEPPVTAQPVARTEDDGSLLMLRTQQRPGTAVEKTDNGSAPDRPRGWLTSLVGRRRRMFGS